MPQSQGTRFTAEPLTFVVRHQLWDANVEDHSDQGISIEVAADVDGKQTTLLRFNCFDIEKSYIYGPENPELTTDGRVGGGMGVHCRMDPITDGNAIGWTIRTLGQKLPKMLDRAGYKEVAKATDPATVRVSALGLSSRCNVCPAPRSNQSAIISEALGRHSSRWSSTATSSVHTAAGPSPSSASSCGSSATCGTSGGICR